MARTIWKFPLEINDIQRIRVPAGAVPLHVDVQNRTQPMLWCLVNTRAPQDELVILTFGTGQPIPDKGVGEHLGTYLIDGGGLVFHVFLATDEYYS